jgi:hypothetical protein
MEEGRSPQTLQQVPLEPVGIARGAKISLGSGKKKEKKGGSERSIRQEREDRAYKRGLWGWAAKQLIQTQGIKRFWDHCKTYKAMNEQRKQHESVGVQIRLRRVKYTFFVQQCILLPSLHSDLRKFMISKAQKVLEEPPPLPTWGESIPPTLQTLGKYFPTLVPFLSVICQLPAVVMEQGEAGVTEQSSVLDSGAMGHSVNGDSTE